MTIMVAYPYDPSGTRDECHIQDESHVILTNDNTFRVIVPELAPFFKHDLTVIHTASRLELKEGKDYNLGYKLRSAEKIALRDLYGCIVIINPELKGEFFVSYRSVGGDFVGIRSEVITYLANALNDPTRTPFEKVLNRPAYYTPPKHEQHYADFLNKEFTEEALDDIVAAIDTAIVNTDSSAIGHLNSRITQLDNLLNQYNQAAHLEDFGNPHDTTADQVKALPLGGAALDTFSAYNLTLVELATYINDRGITQDDVDRYLAKYGDQFYDDRLTLKDGQAVIRNAASTTSIDLSNGNVVIKADGINVMHADSDISSAGEVMSLISGMNRLDIISSGAGGLGNDKLVYNGFEVIHGGTVRDKLKAKGSIGMRVVTQDTETVTWEGTSRPDDKLRATLTIAVATLSKRGAITLSNNRTENSRIKAPTPYVLNEIRKDALNRVNKSTTINGHPLTSNFSLDKDDINLDLADNTSDKEKPVSTPQQELLDQYSEGVHTHDLSKMDLPLATKDSLGVVKLISDITDLDTYGGAATPKAIAAYAEHIVNVATISGGKLPNDVLDVRYWQPASDVICSGLTINFPAGAYLYLDRVDYTQMEGFVVDGNVINFSALFPNAFANETFYIYIEVAGDNVKYVARKDKVANSGPRIHIATIKCGATEILNVSEVQGDDNHPYDNNVNGVLEVDGVTSVGMFRELEEHEADETAHIGNSAVGDASTIGLDLINNYPVVNYTTDASHSGIDEWDAFTGWDALAKDSMTALPIIVNNGSVDVSNGIKLTIPWSAGGNQMFVLRNTEAGFNNPKFVMDEVEDGYKKRKIGYLLKTKYTPSVTSVKRWHALIGSFKDAAGDVHDVMVETAEPVGDVDQAAAVMYYKNGVFVSTLARVTSGTWHASGEHDKTFLIFEYWETSDGFDYVVDIHHDGQGLKPQAGKKYADGESARNLDRQRVHMSFKDDVFDMNLSSECYGSGKLHNTNAVSVLGNGYVNGNVKKAIQSGVIGLCGVPRPAEAGHAPQALSMDIDCIAADEGNQSEKYITAKGVYQSLRDGVNLIVASGVIESGYDLPTLSNCRFTNVYLGINAIGGTSESVDVLDGIDFKLMSTVTGEVINNQRLDMLSIHRYAYPVIMYKTESQGSGGTPNKTGSCNYMLVGLRDV